MRVFATPGRWLPIALLWGFVLATNLYLDPVADREVFRAGMSDSFSYLELAEKSPGLPTDTMAFQHAQRLAIPYTLGLAHDAFGIALHPLFLGLAVAGGLAILLVLADTLLALDVPDGIVLVVAAMVAFNPWAMRLHLAYPEMADDIPFALGLAMVSRGLVTNRPRTVVLGEFVAAIARQTAILILPFIALWLFTNPEWRKRSLRDRLACLGISGFLAVTVYLVTGAIARRFAAADENWHHMIGLWGWLANSFNGGKLLGFLALAAEPAVIVVGVTAVALRLAPRARVAVAALLAGSLLIWIQPVLAGPDLTGGNAQRLTSIGLIPAAIACAIALRDARLFESAAARVFAIATLAAASLHAAFVSPWIRFADSHAGRIAWYGFCGAAMLLFSAWSARRSPAARQ